MLLKESFLQKCTLITRFCHENSFHISVSTSSSCFRSYFGRLFDFILIVSTVVYKLVEFCIFIFPFIENVFTFASFQVDDKFISNMA